MEKQPGINDLDDEVRHVFLADPSWGKWLTLGRASDGIPSSTDCPNHEFTPIPYDHELFELIVPASLRLPSLLTRALLMCSGLPPRVTRSYDHFSTKGSLFLPESDMPYSGTCYAYQKVPLKIAQAVCSKVSAWPVVITENNMSTLRYA
jgi:hypothetical protein